MLSSCNIIKKPNNIKSEKIVISTEYEIKKEVIEDNPIENEEERLRKQEEAALTIEKAEALLEKYKEIGTKIIKEAKEAKEAMLNEAKEKIQVMEKETYEKAYEEGMNNGHEDGRNEAYEKYLPEAKAEAEELIENASALLKNARDDYEKYLEDKKNEIVELSISIAESILKKEILKEDAMNKLIEEGIELSKNEESIVIRCNSMYEAELKENISLWKTKYNIKDEIFVLIDKDMDPGNAAIEKKSGKVVVGYDIGMEKIKKAILG